jgi:acyl-coenzyme A synthetase/AMP-(fatty) acid ligase
MEILTTTGKRVLTLADADGQSSYSAFSFFNGQPVARADLLRHALNVSRHLPDGNYALNLCRDRYFFIVAFLAALLKKQRNLLPPNQTPCTVAQLLENYPHSYCIADTPEAGHSNAWVLRAEYFDGDGGNFPLIPEAQAASISFTSGSTGQPKAIAKTWGEFRHAARLALRQLHLPGREWHIVSTVPPQHMYGLETSLFWPLGSQLSIDNRQPFFPEDIRRALNPPCPPFFKGGMESAGDQDAQSFALLPPFEKGGMGGFSRPCLLVSTPAHLKACVGADLSWQNIAMVLSSTGPLPPDLAKAVEQKMNAPLLEIFGSTETQSFASRRLTLSEKWTPYAGIKLCGEDGTYRVSGGHLRCETVLDDQFEIAADGLFTIAGRSAEIVKVAGKRASLAELNNLLNSIDGVADGVFFQAGNERLGALAVTRLTRQQIFDALKPALDPVFLPRPLYRVERLPRNELGKIDRRQLQELIDACRQRRDI